MGKGRNYIVILLLMALMIGLSLWAVKAQASDLFSWLSFYDPVSQQALVPYQESDGRYYLFLPSHTQPEQLQLQLPFGFSLDIRQGDRSFGSDLSQAPLNTDLTLTLSRFPLELQETVQLRQNENIPSLHIRAGADLIAYLHENQDNQKDVFATLLDTDGSVLFARSATIAGRGNGSWFGSPTADGQWSGQAKRPYNLNLSSPVSFAGFDDASKLCLLAEYSDPSKLRNSLAYFAARELEVAYASPYLHVDVFVGGEYLGLYGIATKEGFRQGLSQDQTSFEITSWWNKDFSTELGGNMIRIFSGSQSQLQARLDAFEAALYAQDWDGCSQYVNLASFAKKYALEEFLGNTDLCYASQYFYTDAQGKFCCMLPWDYDWTLGSSTTYYNNRQYCEIDAYRLDCWYGRLLEWDAFREALVAELEASYTPGFFADLDSHIRQTMAQIGPSRENDILRWQSSTPYSESPTEAPISGFSDYQDLFSQYFPRRAAFLRDYFGSWENYCLVQFQGPNYGNFCIPKGSALQPYLEGASILNDGLIWTDEQGRKLNDIDIITEDINLSYSYH